MGIEAEMSAHNKESGRSKAGRGARYLAGLGVALLGGVLTMYGIVGWGLASALSSLGGILSDNPGSGRSVPFPFIVLLPWLLLGTFGWLMMKAARERDSASQGAAGRRTISVIVGLMIVGMVGLMFISVYA